MEKILWAQPVLDQLRPFFLALAQAYEKKWSRQIALGIIQVGEDAASQVYIKAKEKACLSLGLCFYKKKFPSDASPQEILQHIHHWNRHHVHGILLQLPLPDSHKKALYLEAIHPEKDVDGLSPKGSFWMPCTPLGCLMLLTYYGVPLEGKLCVVVGRSDLVGKPLALALLERNATVVMAHSRTENLAQLTKQADVLCVAAGKKNLISCDHISPHTVMIDIGIHREKDGLVGDVEPTARERAKAYTPVPGGVGPMTVASLMANTIQAAYKQQNDPLDAHIFFDALREKSSLYGVFSKEN